MRKTSFLRQLLRLLNLLIVPLTILLIEWAKKSPALVETVYAKGIYPWLRGAVSYVTRYVPFSVAEIFACVLAVVIAVITVIRFIRFITFREEGFIRFFSLLVSLAVAAGYMFFLFYAMWGFNYYRTPIADRMDLPERQYTKEELYSLCVDLADKAKALREDVPVNTSGVYCGEFSSIRKEVVKAYKKYGTIRPSFKTDVPKAKPLASSELFSQRGISGIYIFLTEEPNVNVNEPSLYLAFSAAHETAHYVGYAREQEASFLAFLVLSGADDADAAYSGYMHALNNCSHALYSADKELYSQLYGRYSEGMKADLADYSKYYKKYEDTETWNRSNEMNDKYLKFNDQPSGVLSYSEDVALILRYYDSIGFFG